MLKLVLLLSSNKRLVPVVFKVFLDESPVAKLGRVDLFGMPINSIKYGEMNKFQEYYASHLCSA